MKRKILTNVSKRIIASCLSMAMILTGILVMPKEAEAATVEQVYFDKAKEYVMGAYWSSTDKKAPVKDGYVFGGWYKLTDANTTGAEQDANGSYYAPLKNVTAADADAVAKFVPAEVLSIKTQIGTATVDNKTITSMRILSTVDSKNYQAVGFEYRLATQNVGTTKDSEEREITKVYSKIKQSKYSSTMYDPGEEFVSGVSKYFIAADVSSIKDASFAKIVYARPYWITMDGTKVMGLARNSRVEDKQNNGQYTSVGINLLPQLTTENKLAAVAAGKIQVSYNTTDYDVVETPDIAETTNGGKYLFSEMECYLDEAKGTITFVGNADIQGESMVDLLADGLFANVRFKNVSGDASAKLDFTINTGATDFCNWAENPVTKFVVQ